MRFPRLAGIAGIGFFVILIAANLLLTTAGFPTPSEAASVDEITAVLAVEVVTQSGPLSVVSVHLKSKLLSFPGQGGKTRFNPRDEAERARYAAYALHRRAAEAVTVRALVDDLLAGARRTRRLVLAGDLNDEASAATTQILHGPLRPGVTGEGRTERVNVSEPVVMPRYGNSPGRVVMVGMTRSGPLRIGRRRPSTDLRSHVDTAAPGV
jgi:hypothetical protein